jgi:hypothetical protein
MADILENEEIVETPEEVKLEETEEPEVEVQEEEVAEDIDVEKLEPETRGMPEEKVEYGEDIDPQDIKTIGDIVEKQTASVKKQLQETADRLEVESFIQEKPEYSKYKQVMLKYLQHPVYSKIPVKNIAAIVASSDLMKLGAKAEREAQAKANSTKGPGTTVRSPLGGQKDWHSVSRQEFEEQKRRVLMGNA